MSFILIVLWRRCSDPGMLMIEMMHGYQRCMRRHGQSRSFALMCLVNSNSMLPDLRCTCMLLRL